MENLKMGRIQLKKKKGKSGNGKDATKEYGNSDNGKDPMKEIIDICKEGNGKIRKIKEIK